MITIAFCLEVFLFALAGGLFIAHEVRKSRSEAAVKTGRERLEPAAAQPVTARVGRAVPGLRP